MKCRVCRQPAIIDIRRHNANFCAAHFLRQCREQVRQAIDDFDMIGPGERVLVAVSGGKDSLALWDLLLDLGVTADGLYLGLGIGDYSDESGRYARAFAERRRPTLIEIDLPGDFGYDIPTGAAAARRVPCSACGLSKRHLFDQAALDGGYDVMATGHNLDDEAAVLFGNVLRWDLDYLGRQLPGAAGRHGFARKVKPLDPPGRAGDGRLLRAARHRLHRRGVPDGGRQQAPRLQGRPSTPSRSPRRAPSTTSTSASSTGRPPFQPAAEAGAGRAASLPGVRCADRQRAVRLLPAGRAGRRTSPVRSSRPRTGRS